MFATTCPNAEELLAYAVGRLPDDTSDLVAEHLDSCTECQAAIATLDDADDTFVAALKQPAESDPIIEESQCNAAIVRAAALASNPPHEGDQATLSCVGDELGEYRLLDEIGRGGMGRVYRALQTKLDRIVALKVLPGHRSEDRRAIARFEREMKAIGRLDHPNIVHAYDAREIDSKPVLVMEFVEGCDLASVLHYLGRVKMADACELIRQAAVGLQYAHENGLVHRDVKPSNVMLTPQGNVKLLDLGLARFEQTASSGDEMTGIGQPMGTADYMAPEQVSDSRAADIRADIYGLGCTLFKLLAGYAPFAGPENRGTFDKLSAHVNDPPPSIRDYDPSLSDELAALVERMLAKSPDDRPATPAAVAAALAPHCSDSDLADLASTAAQAKQQQNSGQASQFNRPPRYATPPSKESLTPATATWSGWIWGLFAALVLLAAAGGFALGVIITIERDGKKTSVEVPDGSHVAIDGDAGVNVTLPSGAKTAVAKGQSDVQLIQGVWKVVDRKGKSQNRSLLRAGRTINPDGTYSEEWKTTHVEITDKRLRIFGEHELPASHEYQINASESPKLIDVFVNNDELLGVYELDGNQLKVCFDWSGHNSQDTSNVRPKQVWAGLQSDQEMLVLTRVGPVTPHPDENKFLGAWVVESSSLPQPNSDPFVYIGYALLGGVIKEGRPVVITPDEFIIKKAPASELPDKQTTNSDRLYGQRSRFTQPSSSDVHYSIALDGSRHWIGFSNGFGAPCPGIYSLTEDRLVIRLNTTRPVSIDAPPSDSDVILTLRRPDAANIVVEGPAVPPESQLPGMKPEEPARSRALNKQMLILVDALGSVTVQFGMERQHLGSSLDEVTRLIQQRIANNEITLVDIRPDVKAPQTVVLALQQALKQTKVQGFNVSAGPVPLAPVKLDFRIAATRHTDNLPGLTEEQIEQCIALKKDPTQEPVAGTVTAKYTWIEIDEEAAKAMKDQQNNTIISSDGKPYLLVSTEPDSVMLSSDTGERAWKIVRAEAADEIGGQPAISLELDEAGGRRLGELTAAHNLRPLAVVINNKVYMAPRILSEITYRVKITGNLEKEWVQLLVQAFNQAARK